MEKIIISLGLCIPFIFGCSNEQPKIKSKLNASERVSSINIANKESYKHFFLLSKDLKFDKDLHQLEAIWYGKLTLHNNCLSILVEGDKETLYTLALLKNYEVLFDSENNIIGIKNIKSKEQYKIGESLTFGGLAVDKAKMNSNKSIPNYCEPRLALPGDIKK